jgi:hypothetical protein
MGHASILTWMLSSFFFFFCLKYWFLVGILLEKPYANKRRKKHLEKAKISPSIFFMILEAKILMRA